jgi:hypothetical protein
VREQTYEIVVVAIAVGHVRLIRQIHDVLEG